jgi:hypothetical protein
LRDKSGTACSKLLPRDAQIANRIRQAQAIKQLRDSLHQISDLLFDRCTAEIQEVRNRCIFLVRYLSRLIGRWHELARHGRVIRDRMRQQ